jgi:hypothetical protein
MNRGLAANSRCVSKHFSSPERAPSSTLGQRTGNIAVMVLAT